MIYFCSLLALIGIYSILTLSTNLLIGYGGIVSMAQAGVFGIGAYCVAIMTTHGFNFWLAILPAILLCILANIVMTLPSVRAGGLYFMVVSFGFCKLMSAMPEIARTKPTKKRTPSPLSRSKTKLSSAVKRGAVDTAIDTNDASAN